MENNYLSQDDILQMMAQHNYQAAIALCEQNLQKMPTCFASLSNAATAALLARDFDKAIDFALKILPIKPDLINAYDVLSHAYGVKGDFWACSRYGSEALRLRDLEIMAKFPKLPDLPNIRQPENGLQIIAFSLYGNDSAYVETAVLNAQIAPQIYPDWVCRFYVDETVSEVAISRLLLAGAQVQHVDEKAKSYPKTMWRFLPLEDENVVRVIFRDADSVISEREAEAVREWVQSGKMFHIMRDWGSHTELILAGLWGAMGGAVPNLRHRIEHYIQHVPPHPRYADQYFLREHVWAFARQSLWTHDRLFGFSGSLNFPTPQPEAGQHIGQDEGHSPVHISANLPDNTLVEWRLSSKIKPLGNDLWANLQTICQYQAVMQNGQLVCHIPQRYYEGIHSGKSEITVRVMNDLYQPNRFTVNVSHDDGTKLRCTIHSQLPPVCDEQGFYHFDDKRKVDEIIAEVQDGKFSHTLPESQFFGLNHQHLTEISLQKLP